MKRENIARGVEISRKLDLLEKEISFWEKSNRGYCSITLRQGERHIANLEIPLSFDAVKNASLNELNFQKRKLENELIGL